MVQATLARQEEDASGSGTTGRSWESDSDFETAAPREPLISLLRQYATTTSTSGVPAAARGRDQRLAAAQAATGRGHHFDVQPPAGWTPVAPITSSTALPDVDNRKRRSARTSDGDDSDASAASKDSVSRAGRRHKPNPRYDDGATGFADDESE